MNDKIKELISYVKSLIENINISILILLIITDLAFVLINIYFKLFTSRVPHHLIISLDYSYAEMFQYIKEAWIVLLIVYIGIKLKEFSYLSWVLLYSYLMLDDSFQIHEKTGIILASHFDFNIFFGLAPKDIGELTVSATSGLILLSAIFYFYSNGSVSFRRVSKDLFALLILITFFGIFMDLIHATSENDSWLSFALSIAEDGGEMFAMSIALAYTFNLKTQVSDLNFPHTTTPVYGRNHSSFK